MKEFIADDFAWFQVKYLLQFNFKIYFKKK